MFSSCSRTMTVCVRPSSSRHRAVPRCAPCCEAAHEVARSWRAPCDRPTRSQTDATTDARVSSQLVPTTDSISPAWLIDRLKVYRPTRHILQGSQEQKVNFRTKLFIKFQDIFVGFTKLKTQKMHTFLYTQISHADQHMEQWTVTIEHRTGLSITVINGTSSQDL